jgi:aldehyde:ferredoxin oxidoreductase
MSGGYMGKIARVDLWSGTVSYKFLKERVLRSWIGGRGLGVYLMLKEVDPRVDPLSPANKALIMTGPLTGVGGVPAAGRWCSVTKSPLSGTIHDSHSGGKFGPELKFAGLDAIIIEERAEYPVYLWVHNGEVEVRDARHLWGLDTHGTTAALEEELSEEGVKGVKVACIGPAGERLVRFACIINDKSRAAGRGGHGAVWGSKLLKAVAVKGEEKPEVADRETLRKACINAMEKIRKSSVTGEALPKYGTAVLVNIINEHGIFPTRNFQTGVFPTAQRISGERVAEEILDKKKQREEICWGCPIGCARYTRIEEPPFTGEGGGSEYETLWAFGSQTGTDDLAAVSKAYYLCNELGLDTISMGHVIGTFLELVERGKIPEEELRGLKAEWGSGETLVEITWRTAYRSGIGDAVAEGARILAERYGMPEAAMVVRGQELPAYDCRGAQAHGLAYATSNRGGCHLRAYMIAPEILGAPSLVDRFETEGKEKLVKEFQDVFAVVDSLIVCKFDTFALWLDDFTSLLSAVTGWDYTSEEVYKVGERIWNAERCFNILAFGDRREFDTLPRRLLEEPMPEGPAAGHVTSLDEMLDAYYETRGWRDGRPTAEKLEELGLKWMSELLTEEGLLPE